MRIATVFLFILFLNFKICAQNNKKSKYTVSQTGNHNKQYNTIINKEVIFHPDAKLMKQIADSMSKKSDTIIIKFNSNERRKNLAFTEELAEKLIAKNYNIMYVDGTFIDNSHPGQVNIRKVNNYVYLFVSKY